MTQEQIQAAVERSELCRQFAESDRRCGDVSVKLSPGSVISLCDAVLAMAEEVERLKKTESAAATALAQNYADMYTETKAAKAGLCERVTKLETRLRTINEIAKRRAEAGLAVDLRIEAESRLED